MKTLLSVVLICLISPLSGQVLRNLEDSLQKSDGKYSSLSDTVYTDVDVMPEFNGSRSDFHKIFGQGCRSPEIFQTYWTGKIEIEFIVDTTGSISHVCVEKSSGIPEWDAEAIRLVKLLDKHFKPARLKGRPVRAYCRQVVIVEPEEE